MFNLVSEYLPKLDEGVKKSIYHIQADIWSRDYGQALSKI